MSTVKNAAKPNSKFATALDKALDDNVVTKVEARKLRKIAIADIGESKSPAKLADHYSDKFTGLERKSADKPTERYLATVGTEFMERANHANASVALQRYLTINKARLPAVLKNVDVADKAGFEVGTSMQRGVWLRIPLKDQSQYYETTDAVSELFKTVPSLKKFQDVSHIWIIA